jgi:hypothetical protein
LFVSWSKRGVVVVNFVNVYCILKKKNSIFNYGIVPSTRLVQSYFSLDVLLHVGNLVGAFQHVSWELQYLAEIIRFLGSLIYAPQGATNPQSVEE